MIMKYADKTGHDIDAYISDNNYVFQKKFDGVFVLLSISKNYDIEMISRNGKLNYGQRFSMVYNAIKSLISRKLIPSDSIFNGELIAKSEKLSDIQTLIQRKKDIDEIQKKIQPCIVLFECAKWGGKDLRAESLLIRNERLTLLKNKNSRIRIIDNVEGIKNKTNLLKELRLAHAEGIMIKNKNAAFKIGGRSYDIVKYKFFKNADCYWKGEVVMSTSKTNKGLPQNITVYQRKNNVEICVGDVGTGFTFEERAALMSIKNNAKITPVVITVKYLCRGKEYKLRHPTFERFRNDKDWKDCVAYEC